MLSRRIRYSIIAFAIVLVLGIGVKVWESSMSTAVVPKETHEALAPITELGPRYYTYTPEAVALAQRLSNSAILYFWAPWCSTCSSLDVEIHKNPELIPRQAIVIRVPYDTATELRKKYAVTVQHTFVLLDKNNEALNLVVGGDPADVLVAQ